jgi:antitoxin component YwqK of YwqJK toxin-antitoxin module
MKLIIIESLDTMINPIPDICQFIKKHAGSINNGKYKFIHQDKTTFVVKVKNQTVNQNIEITKQGITCVSCEYLNGKLCGDHITLAMSGQITKLYGYDDGLKDGPYHLCDELSLLCVDGLFVKGMEHGLQNKYTKLQTGRKNITSVTYDNDVMHGPYTKWTVDGWFKSSMVGGKLNGIYTRCTEHDDQLTEYGSGIMVNDELHGPYEINTLTSHTQYSYDDGKINGLWQQWNNDGKLLVRTYYTDNLRHGSHTEWYPHGQIKLSTQYINGLEHGECKEMDEHGLIQEIGHYHNGVEHGEWIYHSSDGTIRARKYVEDGFVVANGDTQVDVWIRALNVQIRARINQLFNVYESAVNKYSRIPSDYFELPNELKYIILSHIVEH